MTTPIEKFQKNIGIHSLDLLNENSGSVATISSVTNSAYIQYHTNLDTSNYISQGSSNGIYFIREKYNPTGFIYTSNTVLVDNLESYDILTDSISHNTKLLIYPNLYTNISSYKFLASSSVGFNFSSNIFDMKSGTYWRTEIIFDGTGNLNHSIVLPQLNNIYVEENSPDSFKKGAWVTITLPVNIILTRYHISAVIGYEQYAPTHFLLFGYDYVLAKWRLLSEESYFDYSNNPDVYIDIPVEKQFLYDKFTLLISQVNGGLYLQISSLEFFAKPIININNSIKISNDNLYNVNTLVAKELRLNNDSITTFSKLINDISEGAVKTISSTLTLNWSNTSKNNIVTFNNVGINNPNPTSTLHVNGDILYNRRIIDNYLSIYPHPDLIVNNITIPRQYYTYPYITIGKFNFVSNDYFFINIYSIDVPINSSDFPRTTYYQKISLSGICNPSIKSIYYDNEIDKTYLPIDTSTNTKLERITDVSYYYTNDNTLEIYVKYNDLLNITSPISPKNFSNMIYVDLINTKTNSNNNFIINTVINYPSTGIIPINAIKNSERIIDNTLVNSNIYNNYNLSYTDTIIANSINLTNNNYTSNNILYTDTTGNIKSTTVSKIQLERINYLNSFSNTVIVTDNQGLITQSRISTDILNGLSNVNISSNRVILTDDNGILTFGPTTNTQLNGLYNISFSSNKVLLTDDKGIITYSSVTNLQLQGLSNISNGLNKVILTDNNGILTYGNVNNLQLNGLYNISLSSNNILATDSNGLITFTPVTYDMLMGLSNINSKFRKFVLTDDNGFLTTTNITSSNAENLNNVLTMLNFNQNNVFTYSNIIIGSNVNINNSELYVKGRITTNNVILDNILSINQGNIRWNSNINVLEYNNFSGGTWKQFSEDIFKTIAKYPPTFLYSDPFITDNIKSQNIYSAYLNNTTGSYGKGTYIIKTDRQDDGINNTNIFKIFTNNNNYWRTFPNFDTSLIGYLNTKYIDNNISKYSNTSNGAYFIITLPEKILPAYYNIYYNYTDYTYQNTIKSFKLFGYNSVSDYWDLIDDVQNKTTWDNNYTPNTFYIDNVYNKLRYDTFCLCILKTNTSINNNYAVLHGFEIFGINNYYGNIIYNISSKSLITSNVFNNNSNIYTKAFQTSPTLLLGTNNVGINNNTPSSLLSVGCDIYSSNSVINSEPELNLNHSCNIDNNNVGIKIINLTRPSNNSTRGIRVSHILNTWVNNTSNARTQYDINLSDGNYDNDNNVISMLSDGRVGIGMTPDIYNYRQPNLSVLSNIYLYNTKNANSNYTQNFINIGVNNISSNYGIVFPSSIGSKNTFLYISNVTNNSVTTGNRIPTAVLDWVSPNDIFKNVSYAKIGYQNVISCNIDPNIKLQIAGSCIIGCNLLQNISSNYISQNTLIVAGQIYTTNDVTTDSDISYKYNIKKIRGALNIINRLNGYTFNRNDIYDGNDRRYCGLIAQEVNDVIPEAIQVKHDNKLRVYYNNLAGLFVEGIKEHDDYLKFLDFKLNVILVFISILFLVSILI
jgi:hypothetical protein